MTTPAIGSQEPGRGLRVAVVAYTEYSWDARVRREAESLVRDGCRVHVIAVRPRGGRSSSHVGGVHLHELPMMIERGGIVRYAFQYSVFLLLSSVALSRLHVRRKLDVIHVHSLPDFQVLSAVIPKAFHVGVLLDLHEAMPELFLARFRKPASSLLYRLLVFLQVASCRLATHIVVASDGIKFSLVARGVPRNKITTVPNTSSTIGLSIPVEDLRARFNLPGGKLIAHAGGINEERDLETLILAIARLPSALGISLVLAGQGEKDFVEALRSLAASSDIAHRVHFVGRLLPEEARALMGLSEVGVVTLVSNPHTELSLPARVADFVMLRKPLVVADLRYLKTFLGASARYYTPGDADSLAMAIETALEDKSGRASAIDGSEGVSRYFEADRVHGALREAYHYLGVPHGQ